MRIKDKLDFPKMEIMYNNHHSVFQFSRGMVNLGTEARPLYYKDNGSDVLAVAHMDSVRDSTHFHRLEICGKDVVLSTRNDDRAGVYIILDLLPKLGINVDVLLTTDEEISQSTASEFITTKKYNWMVQFDRRLNDAVTYMYDNKAWETAIKLAGFKIGRGSASDISKMEKLGISGMNVGCGYDDEHDPLSHLFVDMMCEQVALFSKFYYLFRNTPFPHTPEPAYVHPTKAVPYSWTPAPIAKYKPLKPVLTVSLEDMLDCDEYRNVDYYPSQCKFCENDLLLYVNQSDWFIGICAFCEDDAVLCEDCGQWMDGRKLSAMMKQLEITLCGTCEGEFNKDDHTIDDDHAGCILY